MPSLSLALAAMVTVAGRVTLLLSAGVMMLWRESKLARVKRSMAKQSEWRLNIK